LRLVVVEEWLSERPAACD